MANRLIESKSPYLLQHADNPVDWYPWGAEAFEKAAAEDKPVLLSIGYSACHWCHEMARESYEDPETAMLINRNFVPVKVDREERPDVDKVYIKVCHAMTGGAGWPLHILLTPSGKPFFAGTYFPKERRTGQLSFKDILYSAAEGWSGRRQEIVDTAGKITDTLGREDEGMYTETISSAAMDSAAEALSESFDATYGGFGGAPKFPMPHIPMFLSLYGRKYANMQARLMAEKTLQKIHDSAICDHVGGGYFRYATDREWKKPHFEKMLYDNALMAIAFFELGGSFLPYGEDVLTFLQSEMRSEGGGFFSAISAESVRGEGAYYLWDAEEVKSVLGKEAKEFCRAFHIDRQSLPYVDKESASAYAGQLAALYKTRKTRPAPETDRKILTGWNALCAVAFAKGGAALGKTEYTETAKEILAYVDAVLRAPDGRLYARSFGGEAGVYAFSEDYAFLLWAQLTLYETTGEDVFLMRAKEAWGDIVRLFWTDRGGVFHSARDGEKLIYSIMEGEDGAVPPANGVLALCLYKLYTATGDVQYKTDMEKIFFAFGGQVNAYPEAFTFMLYAKLMTE